jgi:LSD1 subclass zinc finger protein
MAGDVPCSHCGTPVPLPEGSKIPWVKCPQCQARIVNPQALRRTNRVLAWPGVAGTMLLLLGSLGWVFGLVAIAGDAWFTRGEAPSLRHAGVHTVCCALTFVAGVLMVRAGEGTARRGVQLALAALAAAIAVALAAISGLIVVYAVCLAGRR